MVAGGRVLLAGRGLVRIHVALGATDDRPLACSREEEVRLVPIAAGVGPVTVSSAGVSGRVEEAGDRPALTFSVAWDEVDDVSPAASGGVRFLSTRHLGALTVDPIRLHATKVD